MKQLKDLTKLHTLKSNEFAFTDNDVLVVAIGSDLGKVLKYEKGLQDQIIKRTILIRPVDESTDLFKILSSKQDQLKQIARGSAVPKIFAKDLGEISLDE